MQQVTQVPHVLFLLFTIAVVFSVVVQAAVFLGVFLVVTKAVKKLTGIADDLTAKTGPILKQVGNIVRDAEPKVRTVTSQVVEISTAVRDQTMHVNTTVDSVVDKTQAQVARVDDMVSSVIGSIAHAGTAVQESVSRPVRKVAGLLHGLRVGADTLFRSGVRPANGSRSTGVVREDSTAGAVPEGFTAGPPAGQAIHPPATTSSPS